MHGLAGWTAWTLRYIIARAQAAFRPPFLEGSADLKCSVFVGAADQSARHGSGDEE
jgi:hypothetical protein